MRAGLVMLVLYAVLATCTTYWFATSLSATRGDLAELKTKHHALVLKHEQTRADVLTLEGTHAKARTALRKALDASPDWAAGRTPAAVADSLCNTPGVRCKPGTVRTP